MHCERRQGLSGNLESPEVLTNERVSVQHLPCVAGTVKQRILDVEIAEDILARQASKNGPLPVDSAGSPVGQSLQVPGSEVAVFDERRQGLVLFQELQRAVDHIAIERHVGLIQIASDGGALR